MKNLIISHLVVIIFSSTAFAQTDISTSEEVSAYTLDDCLEIALQNNVAILEAIEEMEAASGLKLQAVSEAVPHLYGEAAYTYQDRIRYYESGDDSLPINRHDNYHVGLTLEQNVYQGGRVIAGIKAANFLDEYSQAYLTEARLEVAYLVKSLFYLLCQQEGILRVRQQSVENIRDYRDTALQKFEQGSISEFDKLTAEVRLANALPPVIEAENQVDLYKTKLAKEMGLDQRNFEIVGNLAYVPFEASLELLHRLGKENRPLLQQVLLMQDIREQDLAAAESGYQPQVSIYASWVGDYPNDETPPDNDFQTEWFAGAALTWDLFDGLKTPGKVAEAKAYLNQAIIKAADTNRTVRLDIKQAYLDVLAARKALESQRETVGQAEKAYQIARIRWENGVSTSLELTDAELNLSEAKVMLEKTIAYYVIALAGIERAVGLPLKEIADRTQEEKPGGKISKGGK